MSADYFTTPGVNWSSLKHLRESALAYKYRMDTPQEDTTAFALGRLTHTLTFEPEKFSAEYAIWDNGDRRGTEWKEFKAANEGKTIFKPNEIDAAVNMADAVRRHPLVQPYLVDGQFEHAIWWPDPDTGMLCKAKPDWIVKRSRTLIDLKTARSIDGRRFGAEAARYGYHCQLAHYSNGVTHSLGWTPKKVLIVAVEKEPPHDVAVFELDEETLWAGNEEVRELLAALRYHTETDTWPGRYDEPQALQLPAWVFGDDDEDIESFGLNVGD